MRTDRAGEEGIDPEGLARVDGRPLRVAFFSKRKSRTLYTFYIRMALERLGARTFPFRISRLRNLLGERLADLFFRLRLLFVRPDLVIVFSGDIIPRTLDHCVKRSRTALLLDDYFPTEDPIIEKIRKVDVFVHTMRGQLRDYERAGAKRAVFIPSGVDPEYHRIVPPGQFYRSDCAFIGKAVYPDRISLIRSIAAEFDLAVYGDGWEELGIAPRLPEADVPHYRRICSSAHIMIGIDKSSEMELYFSNRTWFTLGCGGFLLTRYVPGLEEMFTNHEHLVWFRDADEARELIRHYLPRPRERMRIAGAGHRFVHQYYPVDRMAKEILRVVLGGGDPSPLPDPREGERVRRDGMAGGTGPPGVDGAEPRALAAAAERAEPPGRDRRGKG